MGIFDFWKKRASAPDEGIDDHEFGRLAPDDELDEGLVWVGEGLEFDGRTVLVSVLGDVDGPSAESRATLAELREKYDSLRAPVSAVLAADVDAKTLAKHDRGDTLVDSSRLVGVSVFGAEGIDLTYMLPWDPEHEYTVCFEGWTPTHYET